MTGRCLFINRGQESFEMIVEESQDAGGNVRVVDDQDDTDGSKNGQREFKKIEKYFSSLKVLQPTAREAVPCGTASTSSMLHFAANCPEF